jgi:hypothetical protein
VILMDRFWAKVEPEPNSGCWLWTGAIGGGGYGHFRLGRIVRASHRIAYEAMRGQHAAGLELDHLCRVTTCVNPWHLEAVTHKVNMHRSISPVAQQRLKTACPLGHPYDYVGPNGKNVARRCYRCRLETNKINKRRYRLEGRYR